jgi:hypothetical protein
MGETLRFDLLRALGSRMSLWFEGGRRNEFWRAGKESRGVRFWL